MPNRGPELQAKGEMGMRTGLWSPGYKIGSNSPGSPSLNTRVPENLRRSHVGVNIILPFNVRW